MQQPSGKKRFGVFAIVAGAMVAVAIVFFFVYLSYAFPRVRCEAVKHLDAPDLAGDCYGCHVKSTPKVAQDWYESKHGIQLVRCFVCHGQPDGKGTIAFAVKPDVNATCVKCHDPSVVTMAQKYGLNKSCAECHPFHQNSIHHATYAKPVAKKTID